MAIFAMPSLGADMEAGTLVQWMIQPGDTVKRGDVVAVVETQKGAIEIECFEEGIVQSLDAELGATLAVGAALATISAPGTKAVPAQRQAKRPTPAAETKATAQPADVTKTADVAKPTAPPKPPLDVEKMPLASPAARVLAAERGVNLEMLVGSGPGGAVLLRDVPSSPPTSGTKDNAQPSTKAGLDLAAMRTAIAKAMARSKREIPHYYLTQTIDLQLAFDWLSKTNAQRPPEQRLLMGALFVKASSLAAAEVAQMNGHYDADGYHPSTAVHAGVAIALRGGGLVAPALHDTDSLPIDELMEQMRDVVARARAGRLRSSEMVDGTITVSAMGDTGADAMAAVIYPPQVAIVGFGAPVFRPWIAGDTIVPRMTVTVTLSADHRVSDGRRGAKFLAAVNAALQTPEAL